MAGSSQDTIALTKLDAVIPRALDPRVCERNLAALDEASPALANQLRRAQIPPDWRPTTALDGSPTFRVPAGKSDAPLVWLDQTALPRQRAASLTRSLNPEPRAYALPVVGAGHELAELLRRQPPHMAIFVFCESFEALVAILSIHDFAAPIRRRAAIFLAAGDPAPALLETLRANDGLIAPTQVLVVAHAAPERLQAIHRACTQSLETIEQERAAALERTLASVAATPTPAANLVQVVALTPDRRVQGPARALIDALNDADRLAAGVQVTTPITAHLLHTTRELAAATPAPQICIGHGPEALPEPLRRRPCHRWHVHAADALDAVDSDAVDLHLAASPRIAQVLRDAGIPKTRIRDFHWPAASTPREQQSPVESKALAGVLVVADLVDGSAQACGIRQPTHKLIWEAATSIIRRTWNQIDVGGAMRIRKEAERTTGVSIDDSELRRRFERLIDFRLIPAISMEQVAQELRNAGIQADYFGAHWARLDPLGTVRDASLEEVFTNDDATPRLVVLPCWPDPFTLDWTTCVSAGLPAILPSKLTAGIRNLFPTDLAEHITFAPDLRQAITQACAAPQALLHRARQAAATLQAAHTITHRLAAIAHAET